MKNLEKKRQNVIIKRLVLDAVMIAMFLVLSLTVTIRAGALKITFASLPVIICATVFGPVDAFLVGTLGALLEQMLTYGFTPTTILWILPAGVRGLFVGLCIKLIRKWISPDAPMKGKGTAAFFAVCIISAVIVSCMNTFTLYVDSNMYGYYTYALVFGAFVARVISGVISSSLMAAATLPVTAALKRAKIIS